MYFNPSDQEAYVLTIHGTPFRIVTARFSLEYLSHVPSPTMPLDQHLHVRRSRCYEMENPGDRVEALKACVGLVKYMVQIPSFDTNTYLLNKYILYVPCCSCCMYATSIP